MGRAASHLQNDTYSGNTATQEGGAIYNAGTMTVYGCTLSGNTAELGGGLFNDGGTVTLCTATLAANTATRNRPGGALYNNGTMTLSATTVAANVAYQAGGIWNSNSLDLVNTIVAGNTLTNPGASNPDMNGSVAGASAFNLIGNGTGLSGISNGVDGNQVGSSSAPINPLLAPLGPYGGVNETIPLLSGSPALAAGGPFTNLTAAIGTGDTVIPVADAAVFESTVSSSFVPSFEIDGELMSLESVDLANNTITVAAPSLPLLQRPREP